MITFSVNNAQVQLPNPDMDDEHIVDGRIMLKRTMSNRRISYVSPEVHATRIFRFSNLNRPQAEAMRQFMIAAAGKEVQMIDFDDNLWKGRIVDTPWTSTHAAIRNNQFTLTFEGHIFS